MGRQLASFDGISYTYNEDGIRTSKTSNGVTTQYYLNGSNIIYQTDGTNNLYFFYDSKDNIVGFNYADNDYFYVKNQQGDITDIANSDGNIVTSYTYDAWGKVVSVSGDETIGNLNPFRYRSYYYDSDIQMYYLQSRYYDADVGRFINCDDVNYIGITESELSYNPFAYCENNPVNDSDPSGHFSWKQVTEIFKLISDKIVDVCQYLLNKYSVSKKRYIKTTKYKTPSKVYAYVNNNKSKIKYVKNNFSSIAKCLGLILDAMKIADVLNKGDSIFLTVAEIMFDGLIRVLSYAGSKLVEFIISNIAKPLILLKYAVKAILNYAIDRFLQSKYVNVIKKAYMNYIRDKTLSLGVCLSALFKGTTSVFA